MAAKAAMSAEGKEMVLTPEERRLTLAHCLMKGFAACRGAELALAGSRGAAARTTVSHFHHTPNGSDCEGIV